MKRRKKDTETRNKKKKKRKEKKREKERERERKKRKNGKRKNDERTSERTDRQLDGWMDGWILEWMNEWMTRMGRKRNLKINFYKLYRQIACYTDVLRVSFSLGKEHVMKLLNWRLRGRLMSRSSLGASSPFGGVAKSHVRTARERRHEPEGWAACSSGLSLPSLLELESLLVDYGRNDMLISKLRSIHHLLFCRCTS